MIGLDTNIVIRYVMQDDPDQAAKATALMEGLTRDDPGFISQVSIVEIVWVLSSAYKLKRQQIAGLLDHLLNTEALRMDGAEEVWRALRVYQTSRADFADCLIERTAQTAGCARTMTFDIRAARTAGMILLE